ncbi:hypothetical protein PENSUB_12600 [Penicillium subrubescens]|uniref:Uncharacterized protein n=1 Tax=Penicillium subrubescens TaxID=1316194 RepID=A0A1Q5SXN6_9EURO|nr:hypothetical protein PENSUB_12600 [Penicillium subrubescens]
MPLDLEDILLLLCMVVEVVEELLRLIGIQTSRYDVYAKQYLGANTKAKGYHFSVTTRAVRVHDAAVDVDIAYIEELIVLQAMLAAS